MSPPREPREDATVAQIAQRILLSRPKGGGLGRTVFLIGAGCSISAGIPGAQEIARRMVRDVAHRLNFVPETQDDPVACYAALCIEGKFAACHQPENPTDTSIDWYSVYDLMFERYYTTPDDVRDLFTDVMPPSGSAINAAHLCLGEIVARKLVSTVVTTNFDQLVLSGMTRAGIQPVVSDVLETLNRVSGSPTHPQLLEIHGSRHTYRLRNRPSDVAAVSNHNGAIAAIGMLIHHATTFVVVGYGGREDGVMNLLLKAARQHPDKNLFWVSHSEDPTAISAKAREFLRTSINGAVLPGQDADSFFLELCRELNIDPPTATSSPSQTGQSASIRDHAPVHFGAPPEAVQSLREGQQAAELAAVGRHETLLEEQRQLPALMMDALVQRLGRDGFAEVRRERIMLLAQTLTADAVTDLDRAHAELKPAVEAYLESKTRAAFVRNQGDFLPAALERIARFNEANDFDAGRREVDAALADLERQSGERRAAERLQREELIEAGIRQDTIRGDAEGVAQWEETLVALRHAARRPTWTAPYRQRWRDYYKQGEEGGNNFALLVAIAMGRRMLATARTRDDHAAARGYLGNALSTLGERESGTARLEEAVAAYRAALEEYTRATVPRVWAGIQNNLGGALSTLGERESGTARLEEAVAVYQEVLQEFTRARAPLDWAMTQNNLGITLRNLGARESGTARLQEAVTAYREALQERTRARVPLEWAGTQSSLGAALTALGERETGTARLKDAVSAYRAALEEYSRAKVPLRWAMTQNNLGVALALWGERDADAERLQAAVTAGQAALEERTRERMPLDWAVSCGNLAFSETLLEVQQAKLPDARAALLRLEEAYRLLNDGHHASYARHLVPRVEKARAVVATLAGGGAAG